MSTEFQEASWATDAYRPVNGKTVVMFRPVQKKDNFQTAQQGRPIFKEVIHIVKIPADQMLRIDQPVTELDKEEYPAEWARFQATRETRVLGTPIENWNSITDTQKAEFKAMGVQTIEQFSGLPDSWGQKMMGFDRWRQLARAFVESGKDTELVSRIRKEADDKAAEMQAQIDELKAMIEAQAGNKARR